jgi:hypothetical protein
MFSCRFEPEFVEVPSSVVYFLSLLYDKYGMTDACNYYLMYSHYSSQASCIYTANIVS